MPDISQLYPQPPQQAQGALSGNPLQMLDAMSRIQQYQLTQQQFPALAQQPAANLQNTQIANQTAIMQQQAAARQAVHGYIGNALSGIDKPTADDVRSAVVNASRAFPQIATQYPDLFTGTSDMLLKNPRGIKDRANQLLTTTLSPESVAGQVPAEPDASGAPQQQPLARAITQGAHPIGTPPGTAESAQAMQGDLIRAGGFSTDIYPLNRALELAKSLGPGGMGPGSEGRQKFESFVYSLLPQLVPASMQDKIKNYAELEKYLVNNTQNRAQNLGPHTNQGLATAVTGSPNVQINDLAGVDLIKAQIALRRMEQAQTFQAAKAGPVGYTTAKGTFAANQDPAAYGIDLMSPEQIQKLQKTLKGPERSRFNASLKAAIESGVVSPPSQ